MAGAVMEGKEHLMPLRVILSTISDECRELGEFVDQFQYTISPVLAQMRIDERCNKDVQSLDALSQRLALLAGYIKEVSKVLPDESHVDTSNALAVVSMSELQRRLKGLSAPLVPETSSGELELF